MVRTASPNSTRRREEPKNAFGPISVSVAGNATSVRPSRSLNAPGPIRSTPSGTRKKPSPQKA